ncbi:AI-2E family transporter [Paraburkholderia sp. NMBU_R16]|uniref:AI-2E family transporter n=1 Tax=Paraburkholderia sp. NMBU_R16 TaxID=2698676 RepID=UPI00156633C0|nr:AI-2E family transporter [Paraburkholderia sp. NMBU_R16]NRO95273.1 AI-2E family transporter [Paraburkholderia sp. NMBU_R16]
MTTPTGKQVVLACLLTVLLLLGYLVLRPFAIPIAWAFIIAYVTWPLYERMRNALGGRRSFAAFLMTAILALGLVVPMLLLMMPLTREAIGFFREMGTWLSDGHRTLPRALSSVPWLGAWLQTLLDDFTHEPSAWRAQLAQWGNRWIGEAAQLAGGVGRNGVKFGFAVLTLFFAFRDGETLLGQVRQALKPYLGERLDIYLAAFGDVCRSVVLGIVVTAAAQGALAGIGYWAAGVGAPLLLAVLTGLAALLPFGTPLVWAPVGLVLLMNGHMWAGIGLLLWGTVIVSWIDNLIRPLVISSSGHMPFLLVIFGIFGGIAAFGLVGLFIGPFVMATLLAVWREWQAAPLATRGESRPGARETEVLCDASREQDAER